MFLRVYGCSRILGVLWEALKKMFDTTNLASIRRELLDFFFFFLIGTIIFFIATDDGEN